MSTDTHELLDEAAAGNRQATQSLFATHRDRLRRMVEINLDRRVCGRVDPSDVVQDALAQAHRQLSKYLETKPITFYSWLRQIAWEQLEKTHRRHLMTECRSVTREEFNVPSDSVYELVNRVVAAGSSPSRHVEQAELRRRAREAIAELSPQDRQVLVLRHLEQLSMREIAEATGATEAAVKMRHLRALERLRRRLDQK
jgi:RNA polymerase sigma-70 factor (ECF subfamily)